MGKYQIQEMVKNICLVGSSNSPTCVFSGWSAHMGKIKVDKPLQIGTFRPLGLSTYHVYSWQKRCSLVTVTTQWFETSKLQSRWLVGQLWLIHIAFLSEYTYQSKNGILLCEVMKHTLNCNSSNFCFNHSLLQIHLDSVVNKRVI